MYDSPRNAGDLYAGLLPYDLHCHMIQLEGGGGMATDPTETLACQVTINFVTASTVKRGVTILLSQCII